MQTMMSINEVYKERVEKELEDLREQIRVQKEQAEEQLRVQKEQAIESYTEVGVKYNVDQNVLREDLKEKFGLSDAAAASAIEAARAARSV